MPNFFLFYTGIYFSSGGKLTGIPVQPAGLPVRAAPPTSPVYRPNRPVNRPGRPVYRSVPFERRDLNSNKFKRGFVRFRPVTGLTGPVNRYRSPAVKPVRSGMETLAVMSGREREEAACLPACPAGVARTVARHIRHARWGHLISWARPRKAAFRLARRGRSSRTLPPPPMPLSLYGPLCVRSVDRGLETCLLLPERDALRPYPTRNTPVILELLGSHCI